MNLISFLLGKKYGESDKKGKKRVLALIAIIFLVIFALTEFFVKEYLFLVITIALSLILYFKFVRI